MSQNSLQFYILGTSYKVNHEKVTNGVVHLLRSPSGVKGLELKQACRGYQLTFVHFDQFRTLGLKMCDIF